LPGLASREVPAPSGQARHGVNAYPSKQARCGRIVLEHAATPGAGWRM